MVQSTTRSATQSAAPRSKDVRTKKIVPGLVPELMQRLVPMVPKIIQTIASKSVQKAVSKLYVDVDNLYIKDNKVSIPLLHARIHAIHTFAKDHKISSANIHWFGNTFTAEIIRSNGIRGIPVEKFIITHIDKDTADHMIIHTINMHVEKKNLSRLNAYIVSNDTSIANVAWSVVHPDRASMYRLKFTREGSMQAKHVRNIEVRHPDDMVKIMRSYITYAQRYNPILYKMLLK